MKSLLKKLSSVIACTHLWAKTVHSNGNVYIDYKCRKCGKWSKGEPGDYVEEPSKWIDPATKPSPTST